MFDDEYKINTDLEVPYSVCWGKTQNGMPSLSVEEHSYYVGAVFKLILDKLPECKKKHFPEGSVTLAACHDVGKISPGFQQKNTPWVEGIAPYLQDQAQYNKYHTNISYAELRRRTDNKQMAKIVASHHGIFDGHIQKHYYKKDHLGGLAWSDQRQKFIDKMIKYFGPLPEHSREFTYAEMINVGGLTTISDWVGSNNDIFYSKNIRDTKYILQSLHDLGFYFPKVKKELSFTNIFSFIPNNIQTKTIENYRGKGLYIIEAETGAGKTEAGLYLAYKLLEGGLNSGIYFALPTQVTANRMFDRLRNFVETIYENGGRGINPQLIHGNSWLENDAVNGLNIPSSWFSPNKRSLLADVGVGTLDQALLGIIGTVHSFVRLYGLAGKVVIIDEIHCYDEYTGTLNNELIKRLLQLDCTVIVLSATLTKKQRNNLIGISEDFISINDYPLITYCYNNTIEEIEVGANKDLDINVDFTILPSQRMDILSENKALMLDLQAEELYRKALSGAKVLCVKNTVIKAQSIYRRIEKLVKEDEIDIGILHAYYPICERVVNETFWMDKLGKNYAKRPDKGCILVSTQITEQSVDLDMDYIYTDLAPMDVLLQRMGRLWRFKMEDRPVFLPQIKIVSPNVFAASTKEELHIIFGGDSYIYNLYTLFRTFLVLKEVTTINIPKDVRFLLEKTYDSNFKNFGLLEPLYEDLQKTKSNFINRAQSCMSDGFEKGDEYNVATRIASVFYSKIIMVKSYKETKDAIYITLYNDTEITVDLKAKNRDRDVAKALLSTSVKIINGYVEFFKKSIAHEAISRFFFSQVYVFVLENTKLLTLDFEDTGFKYFQDIGLQYKELI